MTSHELIQKARATREQLLSPGAPFELELVQHHGQSVPAYKKAFQLLPDLLNAGRSAGDREFLVYGDDRWSFNRFYQAVDAVAGRLQAEHHVRPGDRIAIAMRNRPEWAVAFVATVLVGAVPAPLNSFGLTAELMSALKDIEPRWLFCDQDRRNRLDTAQLSAGMGISVVDSEQGTCSWKALCSAGAPSLNPPALRPTDPALILFTSGATSKAKGVLSNHRSVCQAMYNIDYIGAISGMTSPAAIQKFMSSGLPPTTLTAVPLFHVSGLHAQLLTSIRHGRRLVFLPRWDPAKAVETIHEEKVTQFNGAPSMVQQLLDQPGFDDPALTGSLLGLGFGGAGLSQRLIQTTLKSRPDSLSGIGFGMTETNGVGSAISGVLFANKPECSGLISPLVEVKVVDAVDEPLPTGQSGEIWLRGVTVMDSYLNQPADTNRVITQGWFHTGDIGCVDEDGYLRIVDRLKDIINRSGEKIAAAEVESCLLSHPAVQEAAVFAQPDAITGEAIVAVVTLRATVRTDELRAHVGQHLASYKVPQSVHIHEESLPRNPAGKVLKSSLKTLYINSRPDGL